MHPVTLVKLRCFPFLGSTLYHLNLLLISGYRTAVSTGYFTFVSGHDSDMGGPTAGPDPTPPFPGQDFINPMVSLIGFAAVISIEPMPDNNPGPFTLKPLVDGNIEDVGMGVLQAMGNNAAGFPTGSAAR